MHRPNAEKCTTELQKDKFIPKQIIRQHRHLPENHW
jgi:hypothetical protein